MPSNQESCSEKNIDIRVAFYLNLQTVYLQIRCLVCFTFFKINVITKDSFLTVSNTTIEEGYPTLTVKFLVLA